MIAENLSGGRKTKGQMLKLHRMRFCISGMQMVDSTKMVPRGIHAFRFKADGDVDIV